MAPQGIIYISKLKNMQDKKYVLLTIKFNYFVFTSISRGKLRRYPVSFMLVTAMVGCLKA